ncbi:hypothetical protein EBZ37_12000, partial [bacterium]|nr:hypothetical protein [bacterium]
MGGEGGSLQLSSESPQPANELKTPFSSIRAFSAMSLRVFPRRFAADDRSRLSSFSPLCERYGWPKMQT